MNNKLTKLVLLLTTINLAACNSGGTQASSINNSQPAQPNKSTQNFITSPLTGTNIFKNLGWHLTISNNSDESYIVTAQGGGGNKDWHSKDLNDENIAAPHSVLVLYTEAAKEGGYQKFIVYPQRMGAEYATKFSLYERNDGDGNYISNDLSKQLGYALYNHGAHNKYYDNAGGYTKVATGIAAGAGATTGAVAGTGLALWAGASSTGGLVFITGVSAGAGAIGVGALAAAGAAIITPIAYLGVSSSADDVITGLTINADLSMQVGYAGNVPVGSYIFDCQQISLTTDGKLSAECNTNNQQKLNTSLNIHNCIQPTDIFNDNGVLRCGKYRYSFMKSCNIVDKYTTDSNIAAECTDDNNVLHGFSSLLVANCAKDSDILNKNGTLICANYTAKMPKGNYLDSCNISYYEQDPNNTADYGTLSAMCWQDGNYQTKQINYLKECASGSSVSISPKGYLRCDTYQNYITTDEVVDLHNKGQDMELQRLWDLGKIQN